MTSEVEAAPSCREALLPGGASHLRRSTPLPYKPTALSCQRNVLQRLEEKGMRVVRAQMVNPSTYSSRISTDIPLYEIPGASLMILWNISQGFLRPYFLVNVGASNSMSYVQEVGRVQMLPIEFLFLTVFPIIDMRLRCKSSGTSYLAGVPRDISKVLELDIIRWELRGLDDMLKPSQFSLGVKGALFPDRHGPRSGLKGQLQMSTSFVLPPVLELVPEDVRRDVAESVLKRLVENMKDKVNGSLVADYSEFKKERAKALA